MIDRFPIRSTVMRWRLFAAGLALVVGIAPSVALAQDPNFSGQWKLDEGASDFTAPAFSGGRGGAGIGWLFITHASNDTLIVGPETNGLKAWSYTPGKELSVPVDRDSRMMVRSRWDGDRLIAEGTRGNMRMHEVLSLSDDGQTMRIVVTTTTPDGVTTNTLVYTKGEAPGACQTWAMPCKDFSENVRQP